MGLALLVDATPIFAFQQFLKERDYPVQGNINYGALLESLHKKFEGEQFGTMLAFTAINPQHDGQRRFCDYLRGQGFTVDETDFRDAFILPNREHAYQRLSTRLTYVVGMLTAPYGDDGKGNAHRRELPHLVIVTDAFDVYYPLLDYVQTRSGQVTIVFFRRGMEDRWQRAGLFDEDSPIQFCDLSDDAKAIVGADLGSSLGAKEGGTGLADFKL